MKLTEVLNGIKTKNEFAEAEIADVTQDSRLVKPGSLFICIKGNTFDGHSVAADMVKKGSGLRARSRS